MRTTDYEDIYVSAFGKKIPISRFQISPIPGGFELSGRVRHSVGVYRYDTGTLLWTSDTGVVDEFFAEILTEILDHARTFMPA